MNLTKTQLTQHVAKDDRLGRYPGMSSLAISRLGVTSTNGKSLVNLPFPAGDEPDLDVRSPLLIEPRKVSEVRKGAVLTHDDAAVTIAPIGSASVIQTTCLDATFPTQWEDIIPDDAAEENVVLVDAGLLRKALAVLESHAKESDERNPSMMVELHLGDARFFKVKGRDGAIALLTKMTRR